MTTRLRLLPALVLLAATALLGQEASKPADAEAEAALRARVTEFFQYHVDGNFRKAMDMVAEDTKDEYFASGKQTLKSFTIDTVKLTDDNTKAVVNATVKRDWQIRLQNNEVVVPMVTTWKIENGKWVWYHDVKGAWLTPMGPSNIEPPKKNSDGTVTLPKSLNAEQIAAAARAILGQSGIDKNEVTLPARGGSDRVSFKNGVQGVIKVYLTGVPDNVPGFSARLEKGEVASGEQVAMLLQYQPPANAETPKEFTLQIVTEPLNQAYSVRVNFSKADAQ